jgi:hypothetical protein
VYGNIHDLESEKLCAHLTGNVGKMSAELFYEKFNLTDKNIISKYFFKEMMQIFHLPRMENWPKMTIVEDINEKDTRPQICFSLVCFMHPSARKGAAARLRKRVGLAHAKAS